MVMLQAPGGLKARLADPKLRREVEAAVRRRVRGEDAEDLVQATLADVLSARQVPDEPDEFRRFVFGVARNKVFDHFRRRRHQAEGLDETQAAAPEPPLSARDILRWAEGELGDAEARSTLEWMLREGDGEKLEHIAQDARLPATRVRKRVSRLRKLLRERWAAELALVGLLVLLSGLGALYWYSQGRSTPGVVEREPPRPLPSAPQATPTARPAGSAAPLPSAVAPAPAPTPSSSAPPVRKAMPKAKPMTTELPPGPTPSKLNKSSSSEWDDSSLPKTQQMVAPSKARPSLGEKK